MSIWTKATGFNLGTILEQVVCSITLPINTVGIIEYSLTMIAGQLPLGLYIDNDTILGTPVEVSESTTYMFVIRANYDDIIEDRTFLLTVDGQDAPTWETNQGLLQELNGNKYYILENSYVLFKLQASDVDSPVEFAITNATALPEGLTLHKTGVISGYTIPLTEVNYKEYTFTVILSDGTTEISREFSIIVTNEEYFTTDNGELTTDLNIFNTDLTQAYLKWNHDANLGVIYSENYITLDVSAKNIANIPNSYIAYTITGSYPPSLSFDSTAGMLYGIIHSSSSSVISYTFTVVASLLVNNSLIQSASRTFGVRLTSEIVHNITWNNDTLLGKLAIGESSTVEISATSSLNIPLHYFVVSGTLPTALRLSNTGSIIGKITETTSFEDNFVFDNGNTTFDTFAKFRVAAADYSNRTTVTKDFEIEIDTVSLSPVSTMYTTLMLKPKQRKIYSDLILNSEIFSQKRIYRNGEPAFGSQTSLNMLLFVGPLADEYEIIVNKVRENHKKKKFLFDGLYVSKPKDQPYEVVYIKLADPIEPRSKKLPKTQIINDTTYTMSSTSWWRENLSQLGTVDNRHLPQWLNTEIQRFSAEFIYAIPICFCKPGVGNKILKEIELTDIEFRDISYEIDRLIIDKTKDKPFEQYILFNNSGNIL